MENPLSPLSQLARSVTHAVSDAVNSTLNIFTNKKPFLSGVEKGFQLGSQKLPEKYNCDCLYRRSFFEGRLIFTISKPQVDNPDIPK